MYTFKCKKKKVLELASQTLGPKTSKKKTVIFHISSIRAKKRVHFWCKSIDSFETLPKSFIKLEFVFEPGMRNTEQVALSTK